MVARHFSNKGQIVIVGLFAKFRALAADANRMQCV